MSKQNAALLCLVAFVAGVLVGLAWAAVKGAPAGTASRGPAEAPPGMTGQAPAGPDPEQTAQVERRVEELDRRIEAEPQNPEPYVLAGNLLFDVDRYDEALEYYEKALEVGGPNPNVLTDVGIAHRRLGRPERAVEFFQRAHEADPTHPHSLLNMGVVLFHDLRDPEAALEAWEKYLALEPEGERADMIRRVVEQVKAQM